MALQIKLFLLFLIRQTPLSTSGFNKFVYPILALISEL